MASVLVGFALSLSSTAFALQLLAEKEKLSTPHGKAALHILLFQDLAVIPALAIIPMVAISDITAESTIALGLGKLILVLLSFYIFARYLLRPILRFVAEIRTHEIFTATALLLVLGSALIMESIGVSMALGAFFAGVLVADSEYRYQLEADIEPFKELLLGLFFMAVGMSANLGLLFAEPLAVLLIVLSLVVLKTVILFITGKVSGLSKNESLSLGLCLSQGGEFSFILFALAASHNLLDNSIKDFLVVAVTFSMATTPLLVQLHKKISQRYSQRNKPEKFDAIDTQKPTVVLAGVGRFGQIVLRILRTQGIQFTAIDSDSQHVDFVRRLGNKVFYGDASNKQLLDTAATASAKIFVLAVDNVETLIKIAEMVKRDYPNIRLLARARTRMHEMKLRAIGADFIIRETLLSSISLAENLLVSLDITDEKAADIVDRFYQHDKKTLNRQFTYRNDQERLIQTSNEAAEELKELFAEDKIAYLNRTDST
jgi:glutathione-regulated potassium-efflux system ancillary protein KefC/glutathione-regulated potassium-efflux system protein KefB